MTTIKWYFDHDDINDQDPHEHHHDHLHLVINHCFEGFIVNHTGKHVESLPEDEYDDIFDDIQFDDVERDKSA